MKKFLEEFKAFALKGNVVDMAVGVVIGSAFSAIVNSLVKDIITPLFGIVLGGVDFSGLALTIGESAVTYGNFIQAVVNFLIISFTIFVVIKVMGKFVIKKHAEVEEKKTEEEATKSDEVVLLEKILCAIKPDALDDTAETEKDEEK